METAESILFGYGVNAPVKARIAKRIGKSRSTVSRWAQDADSIPLRDLKAIIRCQGLSDKQILAIMKGA